MKSKANHLISGMLVICLAVTLLGLAVPAKAGAAEVTLNFGHPFPEKLVTLTSWEKWFAGEIETTDGSRSRSSGPRAWAKPVICRTWCSPAAWT